VSAKRGLFLLAVLFAALGAAVPDGGAERNRQLLDRWRQDPDHAARLQRDLRAFYALPAGEQECIRVLDRRLHELPPAEQRRLWGVLERYAAWLERLPEADRRRLAAAGPEKRLKLIREIRDEEFLDRLPAREREEVLGQPAGKRASRVAELRRKEAQRREWLRQARLRPDPWPAGPPARPPSRLAEMPNGVRDFVNRVLKQRLSPEEKEQLLQADGKGEVLARTLVELTERRLSLPPGPRGPILSFQELPDAFKGLKFDLEKATKLTDPEKWTALEKKAEARHWPDFALAFVDLVPEPQRRNLPPLGAARPAEFSVEVQKVIEKLPQAGKADAERLRKLEGRWPEYPRLLLELARKHNLHLPGMSLPGPREWWEYRN
jgi:hypothetical protein